MIGVNGGLIGRIRTYAVSGANSGVWSLDETLLVKRSPIASGGNVSTVSENGIFYTLHQFTSIGDTFFIVTQGGTVEYLIIGGGSGGNGGISSQFGGAGGAAGIARSGHILLSPSTYTITVGTGGARSFQANSSPGGNSSAWGIIATGGNATVVNTRTGASNVDFTGALGVGGINGGGGAGAGANGSGSNGGNGVTSTITGISVVRGGGGAGFNGTAGAGGGGSGGEAATAGAPNTGSGGGGGGSTTGGGIGGSGVVFIRYRRLL